MHSIVEKAPWFLGPHGLMQHHAQQPGAILLESARLIPGRARYSFVTSAPFARFRSVGTRCEVWTEGGTTLEMFGDPWKLLDAMQSKYELLEDLDLPFPLGGAFGYWGYDLKNFVEPRLRRRAVHDVEIPDCEVGFYDSLVAFDHEMGESWIISTGLTPDGTRCLDRARRKADFWRDSLMGSVGGDSLAPSSSCPADSGSIGVTEMSRDCFLRLVARAQAYIRAGDIYQVNLSQRMKVPSAVDPWDFYLALAEQSPAPFAGYYRGEDRALCSSSPELFLKMSGSHVTTRPIKGTRPRSLDPLRDAQLGYELQTSVKERAELLMITDLLRNDLGRVSKYGTVNVPQLMELERYAQVQHLVSTVEGHLRDGVTHFQAFASCFPGGSITGAPKIRAMDIIDELEPVARGPYTGAGGYLGFNRESQLSILIRTAVWQPDCLRFQVGAGIVSDSEPEAEFQETLDKAAGFQAALRRLKGRRPIQR
ncbi:MAG: anthranilate synthase component I family protein [Verrucomicrobia bacterium]|nr:anthranilate synthase component I family protein [Verrucomicrobiota bacterium]